MGILHQLYMGRIAQYEMARPLVEEYERKRDEVMKIEEAFIDSLETEEKKKEFIRILDERTGLIPADCEQSFIQGMRLGAQLALQLTQHSDTESIF